MYEFFFLRGWSVVSRGAHAYVDTRLAHDKETKAACGDVAAGAYTIKANRCLESLTVLSRPSKSRNRQAQHEGKKKRKETKKKKKTRGKMQQSSLQ